MAVALAPSELVWVAESDTSHRTTPPPSPSKPRQALNTYLSTVEAHMHCFEKPEDIREWLDGLQKHIDAGEKVLAVLPVSFEEDAAVQNLVER